MKYESEWYADAGLSKWNELDRMLKKYVCDPKHETETDESYNKRIEAELKPWQAEKEQRIKKLLWWDKIDKHDFPKDNAQVWHLHPVGLVENFGSEPLPSATEILAGRVTYDAEGNNIPGNRFYSRVIHWPDTEESGVTLGRGYDMGSRTQTEVYNHMIASGISAEQATKIARGYGKKGNDANAFVINNRTDIGEITLEQQIRLFNLIYPGYVQRTITNYNSWTSSEPDKVAWESLNPIIKDVLVDFVYQGFTRGPNPMKAGMRNDVDELIRYIKNTPGIRQYEGGRRRAAYLRNNR